jgi:hypothetical protein
VFAEHKSPTRGDRYTYIPTSVVVEALMREGFTPTAAHESNTRKEENKGFTRHMVRFTRPDLFDAATMRLGGLYPEVVISNSHDGTSSYRIEAGMLRLVCLNGLLVSSSRYADIRVRHSGKVVDDVIEGVYTVVNDSGRTLEAAHEWSRITLDRPERELLAETAHAIRFGDKEDPDNTLAHAIRPTSLLNPRRSVDTGHDLWSTFNVIQENVMRGGSRGVNEQGRRVSSRAVKAVDASQRINRALWQMAERFAQMKGVPAAA